MKTKGLLVLLFVVIPFCRITPQVPEDARQDKYESSSYYVPALNGTKLAVDVYYRSEDENKKSPTLLQFTRYWRSKEDPKTNEPLPSLRKRDSLFIESGYVLVKVDVRGTGASFGTRTGEYTPTEVKDAWYIVDWVVNQPWSNGSVGAYGTSYSGTTAELLCATKHEAIKAVIPGWSDFDIYESPGRPYGMVATSFVAEWSKIVKWLDNNESDILQMSVRHVEGTSLREAIEEHKNNPDVFEKATTAKYKDSKFGEYTHAECSPIYWHNEISQSGVPMLILASWMDAGTAEGALLRFQNFTNPQKVVLMPTSHGGKSHASPYLVTDKEQPPVPTQEEQLQLQLDFLDHYLKNIDHGVEDWPNIRYYNFGEEKFRTSEIWPPKGHIRKKYYFNNDGKLDRELPANSSGQDVYKVDYSTSTGTHNRWTTQMGKPVLNLNNRNAMDTKMLTYTSLPLNEDLQITGTPSISLKLSSSISEGAIFVYLEDVDAQGSSRYITEGGMLLEHRKLSSNPWSDSIPYHSFNEADALPMPVNKVEEVTFKLWPTSVQIKKGHSLRISIAGSDKDTFDRVPETGTPIYTIHRNKDNMSFVELPIIE